MPLLVPLSYGRLGTLIRFRIFFLFIPRVYLCNNNNKNDIYYTFIIIFFIFNTHTCIYNTSTDIGKKDRCVKPTTTDDRAPARVR